HQAAAAPGGLTIVAEQAEVLRFFGVARGHGGASCSPLVNHVCQVNRKHVCERIRNLSWLPFSKSIRDNSRGFAWGRRRQQGAPPTIGRGAIRSSVRTTSSSTGSRPARKHHRARR